MSTMNDVEGLTALLSRSTSSDETLDSIADLLRNVSRESFSTFVSDHFDGLSVLERWAWQTLADDTIEKDQRTKCWNFCQVLGEFNNSLIFTASEVNPEKKFSLLFPQTMDVVTGIFDKIERCPDDNDPFIDVVCLWFDNLAYYMYEDTQFLTSSVATDTAFTIIRKFIMIEQYKLYTVQLANSSSNITSKQLFYLQTCSFYMSSYLANLNQKLPFTGDEILGFVGQEYLGAIERHSLNVSSWNKQLLSCLTQMLNFVSSCSWWAGNHRMCMKTFFQTEDAAHTHLHSLIRILDYRPFHQQVRGQRSNAETILVDSILSGLDNIIEECDSVCFLRERTTFIDILLSLAETSQHHRTSFCAYGLLGKLLSEERLKELKIADHLCEYFFYILEQAWSSPTHHYHRTSISQLLHRFLNLAKNDSIQQKTADINRVSLLIDMCDQYATVFDILWALSFNHDIQEQLRGSRKLLLALAHLKEEWNNPQMRKITHGILWNLQPPSNESVIPKAECQCDFDLMISYSHKDTSMCKRIYEDLIQRGYRIWIDFDQMHGNVMDAMAQAIERSRTIIICMSEEYRRSSYCRAEAQYAFRQQLKIVPVLLEKDYRPDGWLLFLIGQLLYINFTKHEFTEAINLLLKELDVPAMGGISSLVVESMHLKDAIAEPVPTLTSSSVSANLVQWTEEEVQSWLTGNDLGQTARLLTHYNGHSLLHLNRYLTHGGPEQVLKLLQADSLHRTQQTLSLVELARFQALLEQHVKKSESLNGGKKGTARLKSRQCCIM